MPFATGIIVYTALPDLPDVNVNVCAKVDPEPAAPPDTLVAVGATQLKVVPAIVDVNATFVVFPLIIVCLVGVAVTLGVTAELTTIPTGADGMPFATTSSM